MDIATGAGLVGGIAVVFVLIMIDGGNFAAYFDKHAVIVIFGGATAATMLRFPFSVIVHGVPMGLRFAFNMRAIRPRELIEELTKIADVVKRQGPMAIENLEISDPFLAQGMRDMATVLNLGMGAFVTTAVAARFVYPMVSLEGRAWWILRTAPVSLERIWWTKFWMGFVPLSVFSVCLVVLTNRILSVPLVPATIIAGLLVGFGTAMGSGCTSGHGVCGLSRGSVRSLAAVMTFMLTGALTAWIAGAVS